MEEMNKKTPEVADKKKPAQEKKPSLGARIKSFFASYKSEVKKIVWCPWKQVQKNSLVVLAVVVAVAIAICVMDLVFHEGLNMAFDLLH